ncbi:MAG TPA: hypothetical protein PKO09_07740 [Anaerolineae bacterium]|nr:hypothetical protein [Anaerolineae bacterium]
MTLRQQSIIVGAILGAAIGALGGYLFTRRIELAQSEGRVQPHSLSLRSVPPSEAAKLGVSIIGVLRGIAELGERL